MVTNYRRAPIAQVWQAATAGPVPLGWFAGLAIAPLDYMYQGRASTYAEAFRQTVRLAAPPLLVVLAVSAVASWYAGRGQQRYFRPATMIWCGFVFLFGVAGLFAYWLAHARPLLVECAECRRQVPRNRAECSACKSPFPPPAMQGTEILD